MNPLPSPDDVFFDQLTDWEARLERGEAVPPAAASGITDVHLASKLDRGLACLKLLNGLRRRPADLETQVNGVSTVGLPPGKYPLPSRFGKFELLSELGRGGFGVVFLARDCVLDAPVAIKMPHAHVLANDQLRERFTREARVAAGLEHPHIVSVREAGAVGPVSYIAYSYCHGISLAEWLRQQKEQVPAVLAAEWVACLAEGLAHAHESGVYHRDLKPANILLHTPAGSTLSSPAPSPTNAVPKITDFGLAKLDREPGKTATGMLLGTPQYMAPEQVTRTKDLGAGVDIHALGVILYELLAGHPPYRGETDFETLQLVKGADPLPLRHVRSRLSRDLETICMKCLQKDPRLRYRSARELAADLRRFLDHEPIQARPISWLERGWRRCLRHPLVTALTVALVLVIAGGLAAFVWQNHERSLQAEATYAWFTKCHELIRRDVQSAQEMLKSVHTEKQGREKLLGTLEFIDTLLREPHAPGSLRLDAGRLAFQAGNIHTALGQSKQAIARFQQAADHFDHAPVPAGEADAITLEKCRVLFRLAFVYRNMKKWDFSELAYRQAMTKAQSVLAHHAANTEVLSFLTNCLVYNAVNLRNQKRYEEAELDYRTAVRHIEQALQHQPQSESLRLTQALVHDDYSSFCMDLGRLDDAEHHAEQGRALREVVCGPDPKTAAMQEALARSYWRLAILFGRQQRWAEAEEYYCLTIVMNDRLRRDNSGVAQYAINAAADRWLLGLMQENRGRLAEAEPLFRQAADIRLHCITHFPDVQQNFAESIRVLNRLTNLLKKMNKPQEAASVGQELANLKLEYEKKFPKQ